MGTTVDKWQYTVEDFERFQGQLYLQLSQLKKVINQPSFGDEPLKLGAELEMYLADNDGEVSFSNQLLLEAINDRQFQPELNQYNLELNLSPVNVEGKPFTALRQEMMDKTARLEAIAEQNRINIIPIGILPTLTKGHLNISNMTNVPRYHSLAKHLYEQRGEAFSININGKEPLSITFDDICAEGANTSFQVHMMTKPQRFVDTYNAALLSASLVTAIGANSPIFLGSQLWDETRIALFKQSLDIRQRDQFNWQQPTRVNFGFGWLRHSAWELYAESVALYPSILPQTYQSEERAVPKLEELNLHMGTIWPWHRPVYCSQGNGHIRLEFRAIPAGPTSLDMVANAAFAIGLANGLADNINELISVTPFRFAEYNFYRAAQSGLDAQVLWPLENPYQLQEVSISKVINKLLPIAKQGLVALGVDECEADQYLSVINARVEQKITGAIWQKNMLTHYQKTMTKKAACRALVSTYLANCRTGQSITQWEQPWL